MVLVLYKFFGTGTKIYDKKRKVVYYYNVSNQDISETNIFIKTAHNN